MKTNLIVLMTLCKSCLLFSCNEMTSSNKTPNILFIMTDQQNATMMSCTGNKWLNTPALDNLASNGIRFEKAYATNPVCVPSRFSLQTGFFPSAIGMRENKGKDVDKDKLEIFKKQSLGCLLRQAGYDTFYGGKVHLPSSGGNAASYGYEMITRDDGDTLAIKAAEFIKERSKSDKPFALFVSFINPHDICFQAIQHYNLSESKIGKNTPQPLLDALKIPEGISEEEFFKNYCPPLPDNHEPMIGEPDGVDSLINLRSFRKDVRDRWTDNDWRMHRWAYMRLTEVVDAQIGIVLQALKESGLNENTIVVFTSDHGDNDASHKLEHKTFFYEESARIPFIVSAPWMKGKGKVDTTHLVSNGLDLLPTLCEIAGIAPPEGMPGRSLVPLLRNDNLPIWREHIFIENEIGFLIHTGRYKYELQDIGVKREVFSDLKVDPGETVNMINYPQYQDRIRDLRNTLLIDLKNRGISITSPED